MSGNKTVKKCIDILELIAKSKEGISLKGIMSALELPKTSAYDILKELVDNNMIIETRGDVTTYKIGLKTFQIGNEYLNDTDLISIAKPIVKEMADILMKTAFIAVMNEGFVTYIYKYEPPTSIITTSNIGTKNPIHCTSLGKAMLSGMSKDEITKELAYSTYEKRTEHTLTNYEALMADIEKTKLRGYSIDDREIEEHTLCIGAPIINHEGKVVAGLSISGFYSEKRDVEDEGQKIRKAAEAISKQLGYRR